MNIHLQRDLDNLGKDILRLGSLVRESTLKSIELFNTQALSLAEEVNTLELHINELEVEIEENCLKVLALHQPVALDLRFIVVVMKVNNDLERMGDQAVNIAKRVTSLMKEESHTFELPLGAMTDTVQDMVALSLEALVNQDPDLARRVVQIDDLLDDLNARNYQALRAGVEETPALVSQAMSLATISSNLERIGDLCTNIAEEVIFMVEGKVIRHML
ncbi:MAG: phosphate signaling complex protein PhoU [Gammaproteobacteria bacterium TMED182]|nr:phosphate transport system regulatory protein PhoU [Gammaproteobacteria bacterium]RPG47699.1 MAG: phosphate signaling complex protein PhoU [Gammaproteobacteria bacterium TMED182]